MSKKNPPPKAGVPKTLLRSVSLFPPCEAFFPHVGKLTHQLALCQSCRPSRLQAPNQLPAATLAPTACTSS